MQRTDSRRARKRKPLHFLLFLPKHSIPHSQGNKSINVLNTNLQQGLPPNVWQMNTKEKLLPVTDGDGDGETEFEAD